KISHNQEKEVILFNTLNIPFDGYQMIHLCFPEGTSGFDLYDTDNSRLSYQIIKGYQGDIRYRETSLNEADVLVKATIPPVGFTTLTVKEKENEKKKESFNLEEDIDFMLKSSSTQTVDTGALRVKVSKGELIEVTGKEGEILYRNLNHDFNKVTYIKTNPHQKNAWLFSNQYIGQDDFITDTYQFEEYGPLRWKYVVDGHIGNNQVRKEMIFYKDKREIDLVTEINCKKNNTGFFKVQFNTSEQPDISADIPFGIEKREIDKEPFGMITDNPVDNLERLHKGSFYAKSFISFKDDFSRKSLIGTDCGKYYLYDADFKAVSLILTRVINREECIGWEESTPQYLDCEGRHAFHYTLSFEKEHDLTSSVSLARQKMTGVDSISVKTKSKGSIPCELSLMSIDGEGFMMTSFKKNKDSYLIRGYESLGKETEIKIECMKKIQSAVLTDFMNQPLYDERKSLIEEQTLKITLKPYEIINLELQMV
ncbi:MAG: hypothetical protein JXQ23_07090, partial [Clostridia bacterium]|nr:hypothetical protein [Clostridia bacterium]